MKISLVLPAHDENKHLPPLLKKINQQEVSLHQIIIVDDGSSSPLKTFSNKKNILLRHKVNLGKGAAMKTGAKFAFKNKTDAVIFMDADGQHDPKEIKKIISFLKAGNDIVFGSRQSRLDAPLIRLLGNKFASIYINILFGVYVSDILSGYRGLTKKAYKLTYWNSSRYGVETEMVARLGKNKGKLKWTEFPIETIYIDKYKGVSLIDAIKILVQSFFWKVL